MRMRKHNGDLLWWLDIQMNNVDKGLDYSQLLSLDKSSTLYAVKLLHYIALHFVRVIL